MQKLLIKYLLIVFDILWLIAVFYISLQVQNKIPLSNGLELNEISLRDFVIVLFIVTLLLYYEKIYDFRFDFWQETLKIFRALMIAFLIVLSILALIKTNMHFSRLFIVTYFATAFVTFPFFKRFLKKVLFSFKFFKEKILIVGSEDEKESFATELHKNWYLGASLSKEEYTKVILLSKGFSIQELYELTDLYLQKVSEVFIVPYLKHINFAHSNIFEYSNIRLSTIQVQNKLMIKKYLIIKESIDKVLSIAIFPFFLCIHFFIAIAIKLDSPGDIFFKQKRLGRDKKVFEVYKYRTMYSNGDRLLEEYLRSNPDEIAYYETYHKYKNDPRITKIGKFLRSTSLDELPQIINVLKGDMNIIGPRPYMLEEEEKLGEQKEIILKVKPGITGLWQVNGRNNLEFKERIELEIWYIKNWSIWLDIVILLKTIKVVLQKTGAQ